MRLLFNRFRKARQSKASETSAPSNLHSDNGREFCNEILESATQLWPEIKIVNGKPRHSQSQGSVERANQDIENMITTWMADKLTSGIDEEEGYGKNVLCNICKKNMDQEIQRDVAKKDLEKQAEKMLAVSNAKHPNVDEGVTVRIKVPEVQTEQKLMPARF
ncbi:hypothetical protein AVEN_125682-1 [Araneus ventricosus]|uniref:Integrase catalytic domain-containing protein n=1 Tax=Araneus ventricosus TaxID=182803 RepID=A0A4Y2PMP2_ARAVE|nr:hypothetical protein AVEN_125682-1 [Araneus ventricosus]